MLKSEGNFSGNMRYEGFCIDLLKKIAHMVGFTYRIELVPDGKYGVYDYETGEWNGIVRQLMDKVSVCDMRPCALLQFHSNYLRDVHSLLESKEIESSAYINYGDCQK